MDNTLISIVGPTAIGKTALSIALAQHYRTEIISADSRQFYKEMRIGTAVPSTSELASAPHHFIQHKSIEEAYSVGDFEKEAIALLEKKFQEHQLLIMVGGSGLYVDAVVKGLDEFPSVPAKVRTSLNTLLEKEGIAALQQRLKVLDPEYYKSVDLGNPHRLIRALEVCIASNKPYSSFRKKEKKNRSFHTITIGLTAERPIIYDRVNQRVDIMMDQGLLHEAESLRNHRHLNALQTVGYKELFAYFDKIYDLETAIGEIKKNTRRFSKRQMTWFKKNEDTIWIDYQTDVSAAIAKIEQQLTS
ncbi:tRNA (adenosine(37)-N6)-dimethylallyltransferase MiaA [Spongiimicrobium salis]|uniref:tRNA (adenosine(37)-N6)-dimethylallyltransferase MiaA n=1 Tax=Spongiimicrobium salis TaxID=1667022 RepID=UPI00374D8BE7